MIRFVDMVVSALSVLFAGAPVLAGDAAYIWWEAENPVATDFPQRTWFSPRPNERALLSGGSWLTNDEPRSGPPAFARYTVIVEQDATYQLWCRKFWKHGPFRWRFNQQPWEICSADVALADWVDLRPKLCANWVHLGEVELAEGRYTFEIELLAAPGEVKTSAFDCFVLTQQPFVPNGKFKPDERTNRAAPGWFAFEPALADFDSDRLLIDLRSMNESVAGENGPVQRDGERLRLGDGREVRFWGVNVTAENAAQARTSVDYLARRLASVGVNLVRYHAPLFDQRALSPTIDAKRLDDLHYLVAALKREGIYTALSTYFPLWMTPNAELEGFTGADGEHPFGLVFFEGDVQRAHRAWLQRMLAAENPYTGAALATESAVAFVELVNEDSTLFYTFSPKRIPPPQWRRIEQQFTGWAARHHGSIERAFAHWSGAKVDTDDRRTGHAGLFDIWHLTSDGLKQGGDGHRRRAADQLRFLVDAQRTFYESMKRWLHDEMNYGGLVIAGNWKTADPFLFDALERYTYTAGDVIDRHAYLGSDHQGAGASYQLREGQTYRDRALVREPAAMPVQADQIAGYPQMISELGWSNPNRYRADAAALASVYGSLQGIDALCWFAVSSNLLRDSRAEKFPVGSPVMAGAFPAAALMYRRGDVQTPPPPTTTAASVDELMQLTGVPAPAAGAGGFDALRAADLPGSPTSGAATIDPRFTLGAVVHSFKDPGAASSRPLNGDTLRSITDELIWRPDTGVVLINTPYSRGAVGFLREVAADALPGITITAGNEYGSVLVVALDDQPLEASRALLVQAITEEQPYGFQSSPAGAGRRRIGSVGAPPLNVREIDITITLAVDGEPDVFATALDFNGRAAAGDHRVTINDGAITLRLPSRWLYTLIERRNPVTSVSDSAE